MKSVRCAPLIGALCLAVSAQSQVLFQTGFEAQDKDGRYTLGALNGQPALLPDGSTNPGPFWVTASGTAQVQTDAVPVLGDRVLFMTGGAAVDHSLSNVTIPVDSTVWAECWFRGEGSSVGLDTASYPTAAQGVPAAAIVHFSSDDGIEALNGNGTGGGTVFTTGTALGPANATNWNRVTLKLNYAAKNFDIYVNGAKKNPTVLGFRDSTVTRLNGFQNLAEGDASFDAFRVGMPLSGDANGDNAVDAADLVAALNYLTFDPATYDPMLAANVAFAGTTDVDGNIVVASEDLVQLGDLIINAAP